MSGTEKVSVITDYLEHRFPLCEIEAGYAPDRRSPEYRINRGGQTDQLVISFDFIHHCQEDTLIPLLDRLDFYAVFSQAKGRKVLIEGDGIRFVEEDYVILGSSR